MAKWQSGLSIVRFAFYTIQTVTIHGALPCFERKYFWQKQEKRLRRGCLCVILKLTVLQAGYLQRPEPSERGLTVDRMAT